MVPSFENMNIDTSSQLHLQKCPSSSVCATSTDVDDFMSSLSSIDYTSSTEDVTDSISGKDEDHIVVSTKAFEKPSVSSDDSPAKKPTKKSVRFFHRKKIRKIPHLSKISDEIIQDCWFDQNDLRAMKALNNSIVILMESGTSDLVEGVESTRGLENKTKKGLWERFRNREEAYDLVMGEQERQWRTDVEDPYIIAHKYQESNKKCVSTALANAKEDEKAIQEYLADTRTMLQTKGCCLLS